MGFSFTFAPLLPALWLGLLALACAGLSALFIWRRMRVGIWRILAMALLLALIANPSVRQEERETVPDVALLVVDTSASMRLEERAQTAKAASETL